MFGRIASFFTRQPQGPAPQVQPAQSSASQEQPPPLPPRSATGRPVSPSKEKINVESLTPYAKFGPISVDTEIVRKVSTASDVVSQIIQGVATITVVAAAVNPATFPIVAGVFIVAAVTLKLVAGHTELNKFLKLNMEQFTAFMEFFRMTDLIMTRFAADTKYAHIPQNILNTDKVVLYAEAYRAELLKYSPPAVINALRKLINPSNEKNALRQAFNKAKINITRNRKRNIFGSVRRFIASDSIMASITQQFQNFFAACTDSQFRFSILMTRYSKEFNEVVDIIEESGTEQEKAIISIILGPKKVQQVAITDEAQTTQLNAIVAKLAQMEEVVNNLKGAPKEATALQAQAQGQQAQAQAQAQAQKGGYSNKTRRQRR